LLAKKHERMGKNVLAVCDKELLGKIIETEKLEFNVSKKFYGGEEVTEKELLKKLKEVDSANLIGNNCIEILEKQGLINQGSIITINGVKHAQIYNLE
jgi:hypothetical protein